MTARAGDHEVERAEREDAAREFFARRRSPAELEAMRHENSPTPRDLLEKWAQQSARDRAAHAEAMRNAHPRVIAEERRKRILEAQQDRARRKQEARDAARREREAAERKRAREHKLAEQKLATAERKRVKARARFAADPQANRDYQRERRAAQRAADPEGYREAKRQRNKRWRDKHRDEQNAKLREKYRDNPEAKRRAAAKFYADHSEELREKRKAYYRANREKQLEKQRQWRAREKRRRDLGLPPRRLHRVAASERHNNVDEADTFFRRSRTDGQVAALVREGGATDAELARLNRDNARARTADAIARDADPVRPVLTSEQRARDAARAAEAIEDARMDAIARIINERLRQSPRRRPDAPGPSPWPPPATTGGLSL